MRPLYRLLGSSICFMVLTYYIYHIRLSPPSSGGAIGHENEQAQTLQNASTPTIGTVVASRSGDNTTWLPSLFPDWKHSIYVTDQPNATLSVPRNQGRESMVYLTYLIDNYFSLPDIVIFLHAERYQWHNDDPLYDGARSLSRLRLLYVREQGYVNLRCTWALGCPHEIHPLDHEATEISSETHADEVYAAAFRELFPGVKVPDSVGVSCCAQFAVSKETIMKRPLEEYERYRRWLLETELSDSLSGRILEYSWHSMNMRFSPKGQARNTDMTDSRLWQKVHILPKGARLLLQSLRALRPGMRTRGYVLGTVHAAFILGNAQRLALVWLGRRVAECYRYVMCRLQAWTHCSVLFWPLYTTTVHQARTET